MKYFVIASALAFQFLFSASALAFSQGVMPPSLSSSTDLAGIYSSVASNNQSNLGKQCKYETASEYEASKQDIKDPELLMSDEEFVSSLKQSGLGVALASGLNFETKDTCFMNAKEYTALQMYTGSLYMYLNSALRQNNKAQIQQYRLITKFLVSALNKIKNYVGYVKRGSSIPADQLAQHQVGAQVVYTGFTSTSIASGFSGSIRYVIYSRSCKYIAPFSYFQGEEEVLCLPGIAFRISYRSDQNGVAQVLMEEVGQNFDVDQLLQSMQ